MKKRKTWRSKLTKTELRHLKEEVFGPGVRITIEGLRTTFEVHAEMRKKEPNPMFEPCRICRGIAKKLGFEI